MINWLTGLFIINPVQIFFILCEIKRPAITNTIQIHGALAPVFDLITTTRFWPQWHPATIGVGGVTERPFQQGDIVRERAQIGAHTYEGTCNVLGYFDDFLQAGDMLVVEDGVVADLEGDLYRNLQDGPNRAVAEFLGRTGDRYGIDQALCDFYGHNVTYAPNGWLRRMV